MTAAILDALLLLAAFPAGAACGYLAVLALLSARARPPAAPEPGLRFDLVVPAHDEERGIAATVESLLALDYPAALRRVIVVADNCRDGTATAARAAGALVLERADETRRGKGYALDAAFSRSLADGIADAVVVVDADSVASSNLLRAFSAHLAAGAAALQAHYGVRNAEAGWRTRLMAIAFALFHGVRSLARERLGLSAGLRGNGMCFKAALLREVPHDAHSVVEDVEFGIRLGLAGYRVRYVSEAEVLGEMVPSERASRSQRRRWEGGRAQLLRRHALQLLTAAARRRDAVLLDLALDLLVPPLSRLAVACVAGLAASGALAWSAGRPLPSLVAWSASLAALAGYVARGWWLSGTGARGLVDLLSAPAYVAWKLALALREPSVEGWVRTARRDEEPLRSPGGDGPAPSR